MKKRRWWLGGGLLGSAIALELILRWGFGLGNPVLIMADPETGYRFLPNQAVTRFGHPIAYNNYSQRSDPVQQPKPPETLRILMTGDSVLNGGTVMGQDQIISEQLEAQLQSADVNAEVLNASAGSWGIGNQWGYLQQFGAFDSDLLIVQIGSHDLFQPTSIGDRVGVDVNYPDRKPLLALQEVWQRYAYPAIAQRWGLPLSTEIPPTTTDFTTQWEQNRAILGEIIAWSRSQNIPLWVLFTPNRIELIPDPLPPLYKAEFFRYLYAENIPVLDLHLAWQLVPRATVATYYRDSVHLTPAGNAAIASLITQTLQNTLLLSRPKP
ncbi:SGNH/GDSL hydrolase family protein [Spirulina major]|uniref:SGNH/GDSL hydrolase family protein n=1 Tax=Spirulina major TaxID=270636 RepID=UPI000933156F|nr:SGNH/GDSL hydrolase family protein [Spirulina major]